MDFLSNQQRLVKIRGKLPANLVIFKDVQFRKNVFAHLKFEMRVPEIGKKSLWLTFKKCIGQKVLDSQFQAFAGNKYIEANSHILITAVAPIPPREMFLLKLLLPSKQNNIYT